VRDKLRALEANVREGLSTLQGDATDPAFVERLLRELKPDLVVLTAGVTPRMGRVDEFDWEWFTEPWNVDVKVSFLLIKQALTLPLSLGSSPVVVSSGAAMDGSPLSGGYAGAKRMQWFLADYAQKVSNAKKLGIRFLAVLPRPIEGTTIGARAAAAYGAMSGITSEAFNATRQGRLSDPDSARWRRAGRGLRHRGQRRGHRAAHLTDLLPAMAEALVLVCSPVNRIVCFLEHSFPRRSIVSRMAYGLAVQMGFLAQHGFQF
jgi:Enoyl-(Acyl carrier protein) reductase